MKPSESIETFQVEQLFVAAHRRLASEEIALIRGGLETFWDDVIDELVVSLTGYVLNRDVVVENQTVAVSTVKTVPAVHGYATWVDHWKKSVGLRLWHQLTRNPSTSIGRRIRNRTRPAINLREIKPEQVVSGTGSAVAPYRIERRVCPHGHYVPSRPGPFLVQRHPITQKLDDDHLGWLVQEPDTE